MIQRITNNINSLNNKKITSSDSAPSAAVNGDMWFDTTDGTLLIYLGSNWIDVSTTEAYNGVTVVTTSTRPSPAFHGQTIYESDTNRMLVWDTSSWIVIANASATNFPNSLDTNTIDSIAALQAKVGVDGSAVTTSLDYKVAQQGLVLVKAQDVTGTPATVTLTSVFSSTFHNYRIITSTRTDANRAVGLRLNGLNSTDYTSHAEFFSPTTAGTTWGGADAIGTSEFRVGWNDSTNSSLISIDLANPNLARRQRFHSQFSSYVSGFAAGLSVSTNKTSTDVTLVAVSGTFSGGTIRVYGYNNG
jgi:hypothetical protein